MRLLPTLLLTAAVVATGCTPGPSGLREANAAPRHDGPAAPEARRAEVRFALSLAPSADCEERFDLALYRDLAIEQIAWDAEHGKCQARRVVVRYLADKHTQEEVVAAVKKLASEADVEAGGAR